VPRTAKSNPKEKSASRSRVSKTASKKSEEAGVQSSAGDGPKRRGPKKVNVKSASTRAAGKKRGRPGPDSRKKTAEAVSPANDSSLVASSVTECSSTARRSGATKKKASEAKETMATRKKAAWEKVIPADAAESFEDMLPEDAITIDRRGDKDRRKSESAADEATTPEKPKLERRAKVNRRRQIDPTTCERDYTEDEIEFMSAIDEYKRTSGRMFPTCSEVLEVLRNLGYRKVNIQDEKTGTESHISASDPVEPVSAPAAASWAECETSGIPGEPVPCS